MTPFHYTFVACLVFAAGVAGLALRRNRLSAIVCCGLSFGAAALLLSTAHTSGCGGGEACFLMIFSGALLCAYAAVAAAAARAMEQREGKK